MSGTADWDTGGPKVADVIAATDGFRRRARAASPYSSLAANTYTINFTVSGVTSALKSMSESLSEKTHNTFVVYGDTGNVATLEIGENASAPSSGAGVQLVDAAPDAGPVDAYFTDSTTSLDDASPNFGDVAGGSIASAGYVNVGQQRQFTRARGYRRQMEPR